MAEAEAETADAEILQRLRQLERAARPLEPGTGRRRRLREAVIASSERFLRRVDSLKGFEEVMRIAGEAANARREELYVVQRVPSSNPESGIDGFRHLLHQERTDSLEEPEGVGP